jgi:hypothetical protein
MLVLGFSGPRVAVWWLCTHVVVARASAIKDGNKNTIGSLVHILLNCCLIDVPNGFSQLSFPKGPLMFPMNSHNYHFLKEHWCLLHQFSQVTKLEYQSHFFPKIGVINRCYVLGFSPLMLPKPYYLFTWQTAWFMQQFHQYLDNSFWTKLGQRGHVIFQSGV